MARPRTGEKVRTGKILFAVEPEMLQDFKTVAFLENTTMTDKFIEFMKKEIENRKTEIENFRKIQEGIQA